MVLTCYGVVPKWPKGTVCKTVFHRFESDRHLTFYFFHNSLCLNGILVVSEAIQTEEGIKNVHQTVHKFLIVFQENEEEI